MVIFVKTLNETFRRSSAVHAFISVTCVFFYFFIFSICHINWPFRSYGEESKFRKRNVTVKPEEVVPYGRLRRNVT